MKRVNSVIATMMAVIMALPLMALAEGEKDYQLKTIRVTAQKTGEDIQETTNSVTALSDVQLEEFHIENFHDLIDYVPNLSIRKNATENTIVIRGISSFAGGMTSSTGFYVDGVNYPLHQMQDIDFMDIERVEVLKGPQGTLYGRNSEAGVINVITKQPGNSFEGKVFADIGLWDSNSGEFIFQEGAVVNIPLVEDKLAVRATIRKEDSDGWMKNTLKDTSANGVDHLEGRMTTRWTPSEALAVSLTLEGRKKNDGMGEYRFLSGGDATKRSTLKWNGANENKVDANAQIIKLEYDAGPVELTSVTGRHGYDQKFVNDMDLSPAAWGDSTGEYDVEIFSEEFRINSKEEEGRVFDWLAGVYAYSEKIDTTYIAMGSDRLTKQDNWGAALFGQSSWHFADSWHLTGGLRLDYVRLEGTMDLTGALGPARFEKDLEYFELLPAMTLAYDFAPGIMAYLKAAKGYLAGGFDYSTATNLDQFSYKPEYSWTYEFGVKSTLFDKKMTLNAATFFIDVTDKQVAQMNPVAGNPENRDIVNAAKVHSYGVEVEVKYQPIRPLILNGAVGYLNSKLKDWRAAGGDPFNYDGKKTPGSPDWCYTIGGTYRWDSGFLFGADLVGVSDYYSDTKNLQKVEGRALVNTRLGYETDSYDVMLWAKNLFDEDYNENQWDWGGATLAQQGAPRSVGLRATYRF